MNPLIQLKITTPLFLITFMLAYGGVSPRAQAQTELGSCAVTVDGNRLSVIGNEAANIIEIVGSERSVQVTCDGASDTFTGIEEITVEGRGGDDNVSVDDNNSFLGGLAINVFSQGRAGMTLLVVLPVLPLFEPMGLAFVGAFGPDALQIVAGPLADSFDITPGREANSVGVQVTDIGTETPLANITGSHIETLTVKMGDGNDQISTDDSNGLLSGIAMRIFGQNGVDRWLGQLAVNIVDFVEPDEYDGGPGDDTMQIMTGALSERFNIAPGSDANSVGVQVTDVATRMPVANINGSELEVLTVKMGEGNDQANFSQVPGMALNIFGQAGDDDVTLVEILAEIFPLGPPVSLIDLGDGVDEFVLVGARISENYEISGVPDQQIPDPEIRVTDLVTGQITADVQVQQTEEIMIEADDGDDRVEVNWDAALMSGLSLFRADLGRGNDTFAANLLPVLTEPPTHEVQTARFEVDAGRDNDQIAFSHSAGSWFDVVFRADTGPGLDTVNGLLVPPPDDGIPGPEGFRQLQFNVVAGGSDDFVAFRNETNGNLFEVFLEADFGSGNDTFEGMGEILDANISPGGGFDTARVTANFRPFVSEFERVEILD